MMCYLTPFSKVEIKNIKKILTVIPLRGSIGNLNFN